MKRSTQNKTKPSKNRTRTVAATIMAVPMLTGAAFAQRGGVTTDSGAQSKMTATRSKMYIKFSERFIKMESPLMIAGLDDGHTIYKNRSGQYFYIDPSTGDMKFISTDIYMKWTEKYIKGNSGNARQLKYEGGLKHFPDVSIVGVDSHGNTLMKNASGEVFHLDPKTGDMIFDR
ncbi:MAG: hypothetical protein JSS75_13330 [Bacteroidetes bacterium]|nr:hypothetical protein [Bacteroidota bacterium]